MAAPDFLLVDKPAGQTSFGVVAQAKRAFGEKRVGHLGTLDPFATGLLVLALGPATRLLTALQGLPKTYVATAQLGAVSTTCDTEGEVTETGGVVPTRRAVGEVLDRFRGEILQVPPAHSAVKVAGERAYELARRGEEVVLAPRPATIHALTVVRLEPPELEFETTVSTGTYIRSLARDIGEALGCGAYLTQLRRTAIGPLRVEDAAPIDDLAQGARSAAQLFDGLLPVLELSDGQAMELGYGRALVVEGQADGEVLLLWHGVAVGLGRAEAGRIHPAAVFPSRLAPSGHGPETSDQ